MENLPTVFLCEAEPASVAGLRWYLEETKEFALIGQASTLAASVPILTVIK